MFEPQETIVIVLLRLNVQLYVVVFLAIPFHLEFICYTLVYDRQYIRHCKSTDLINKAYLASVLSYGKIIILQL
jgi:uncharacterized membrane protein